jgi:hypothetical protein
VLWSERHRRLAHQQTRPWDDAEHHHHVQEQVRPVVCHRMSGILRRLLVCRYSENEWGLVPNKPISKDIEYTVEAKYEQFELLDAAQRAR